MIKSMTAYARSDEQVGGLQVGCEIRSYNSRHLDLFLKLPRGYETLEDKIRKRVSARLARGRIEIRFNITLDDPAAAALEVDEAKARAYHQALLRLKRMLKLEGEITLEMLTVNKELIRPVDRAVDYEAFWPAVYACLSAALDQLIDMRQVEGAHLAEDLLQRIDGLAASLEEIAASSRDRLPYFRERLQERINALTDGLIELNHDRLVQEAAILADKCDIAEELVRAGSHLAQFRDILQAAEPAGRKLNFLTQELNREFNTIGAKTEQSAVAHLVVNMKSELEKIREQVQNIE